VIGGFKNGLELFFKTTYNKSISKQQRNLLKQKGTFKNGLELIFESSYNKRVKSDKQNA